MYHYLPPWAGLQVQRLWLLIPHGECRVCGEGAFAICLGSCTSFSFLFFSFLSPLLFWISSGGSRILDALWSWPIFTDPWTTRSSFSWSLCMAKRRPNLGCSALPPVTLSKGPINLQRVSTEPASVLSQRKRSGFFNFSLPFRSSILDLLFLFCNSLLPGANFKFFLCCFYTPHSFLKKKKKDDFLLLSSLASFLHSSISHKNDVKK